MRPNNRAKILDAAARVVGRAGLRALTLEATAEEAGLTRGGMMYHFRDRDALVLALHEHLAAEWEAQLVAAAGKPADQATADERIAAYARATSEDASAAEFALLVDSAHDPRFAQIWAAVQHRWSPSPAEASTDPAALDRFVLRLAADGLWAYDAFDAEPLAPEFRRQVAERITSLLGPDAAQDNSGRAPR
ncbi:TetR/AcrR family transcriptional regulator [Herbiconiux solani]|uniref:TetR/AcrR family transcriptional regulator n=1 Tax=Herbiconiux solani TaxID=661329 RepID=UPI000825973E|nr:TetR/AcrR family transcriptional regulator [Herbiconiux solani]